MFKQNPIILGILLGLVSVVGFNLHASEKRDLYDEAMRLYDKGQFREAAALFRKVQQLDKTSKYHYNVGQCEYKAKRYGPAIEAFQAFLKGAAKDKTLKKARKRALEFIKKLTPLIGFLEIKISKSVDVWVDDTQRGTTPLDAPIILGEGEHSVVVKKGDDEIAAQSVKIERKKTSHLEFPLGAHAEAKAEFNRGIALYNAGLYEDAAAAFRKANTLKPAWPLFFNIGQSEAAAKRYGLAYEAFQEYLARGGDEISTERQSLVQSELTRLEGLVGSLEIAAPPGSIVSIDGVARGTTPLPGKLKVSVGVVHTIAVHQKGTRIFSKKVKISRNETVQLDAGENFQGSQKQTPSKATATTRAPSRPSPITKDKQRARLGLAISLTGIGAAAAVAGAATGAVVLSKYSRLKEACPEKKNCSDDEKHLKESAKPLATATNVLLSVGATVAIAGTVLLLINKRKEASRKDTARLDVSPYMTSKQAGVVVKGVF